GVQTSACPDLDRGVRGSDAHLGRAAPPHPPRLHDRAAADPPHRRAVAGRDRDGGVLRGDGRVRAGHEPHRRRDVRAGGDAGARRRRSRSARRGGTSARGHPGRLVRRHPRGRAAAVGDRPVPGSPTSLAPRPGLVGRGRRSRLSPGQPAAPLPGRVPVLRRRRLLRPPTGHRWESLMTTTPTPSATAARTAPSVLPPVGKRRSAKPAQRPLTRGEKGFRVVNVIILSGFALLCVIPFVHVIGSSFATPGELATSNFLLVPREFTLDAYRYILSTPTIFRAIGVSTIV